MKENDITIQEQIKNYFETEYEIIKKINLADIEIFINILSGARNAKKQIFIMGNGGSAATASHFANDFNKGISFASNHPRFRVICLNDNVPTFMAYGNDVGYDRTFVEPLKNFFEKDDVVIGISGSGNSPNVINAIEWANQNGGITVGLTGFDGGKLKKIAKYGIHVPCNSMAITEDIHMIFDHLLLTIFKDNE